MKILVLTHEFPPVGGGGGRVARDIASGLARRGHEIHVLTARFAGLPSDETADCLRIQRIAPARREAFRAGFGEMASYDWSALSDGLKLIRARKPDVIHAHFAVPAGAAAFALSRLTGVPYVLTAHLGDVPGALPEKTDGWFKLIYPFTPPIWENAAKVVAVSEFTRQMALKHYRVPVEVIHNGVDRASLPAWQPGEGVPRILFAGRFVPQKNPQHLVEALIRLRDLPWTCAMLGDGPLLESVRKIAADAGLAKRIAFSGWVSPEQVLAQMAQSDLLALPSSSEGLSVVGVQGLAMGLTLILSGAGGNVELVRDGENGYLFPPGDLDALTAGLKSLLSSPAMLESTQAKSRELAKNFDLETIIGQYEQLFLSLGC